MLTVQELDKLTVKELDAELKKATQNLFKIKFEVKTGSSKANHEIRNIRKYRAKIKTAKSSLEASEKADFATQKELGAVGASKASSQEEAPATDAKK